MDGDIEENIIKIRYKLYEELPWSDEQNEMIIDLVVDGLSQSGDPSVVQAVTDIILNEDSE